MRICARIFFIDFSICKCNDWDISRRQLSISKLQKNGYFNANTHQWAHTTFCDVMCLRICMWVGVKLHMICVGRNRKLNFDLSSHSAISYRRYTFNLCKCCCFSVLFLFSLFVWESDKVRDRMFHMQIFKIDRWKSQVKMKIVSQSRLAIKFKSFLFIYRSLCTLKCRRKCEPSHTKKRNMNIK